MRTWSHICLMMLGVAVFLLAMTSQPKEVQTAGCDLVAAPQGSDAASGSAGKPFASAQKLAGALQAGQTGCLRSGAYQDGGDPYVLNPPRAGGEQSPITIRSYPGERARLVGIIKIDVDNITLSGLDIEGTGEQNSVKIYAENTVVENNDITNRSRGGSCMMVGTNAEAGAATGTIIRRNILHDCGSAKNTEARDHAIYTAQMIDGEIIDNLIYNPAAYAITLYPNAQGNRVAHNVIDGASPLERGGIVFGSDTEHSSSKNIVEHNIIAYAETYGITTAWGGDAGSGNIARKNCIWQAKSGSVSQEKGFTATDNRSLDPGFIARKSRDYRLAPRSPCLDLVGYDTAARLAGDDSPVTKRSSLTLKLTSTRALKATPRAGKAMIRLQGLLANSQRAARKRVRISVKVNGRWRVLAKTTFDRKGNFKANRRLKLSSNQSRIRIMARAAGRRSGAVIPITVKRPPLPDNPDPSDPLDPPRPGRFIWESGFENGLSGWNTAGVGDVDPTIVSDIVHSGQRSAKVILTGSQDRSELILGGRGDKGYSDTIRFVEGDERVYAFSINIRSMVYGGPGAHNLFMQFKSDGEGSPKFGLMLWDHEGRRGLWSHSEAMGGDRFLAPIAHHQWHDVVIHFKASRQGNGFYRLYLNGNMIDSRDGVSMIRPDRDYAYIKTGLYRNGANIPGHSEIRVDSARLGANME